MTSVAVVGAGVAGLGAARALSDAPVDVTVFERTDVPGGRAVTRTRGDCRYDVGANYVSDASERTVAALRELGEDGLVTVDGPVWTFDGDGEIAESDRQSDRYTWRAGAGELGRRLADRADATVEYGTPVDGVHGEARQWAVTTEDGDERGTFAGVLLTPPAPRTAALLAATGWQDQRLVELREAVGAVTYERVRSVALHYPFELDCPYYALVNEDDDHAVGWLGREECKPGHVPDGESLLVVQMSPEWSAENADVTAEEAVDAAATHAARLVGDERLCAPDWTDEVDWRDAHPESGTSAEVLRRAEDAGLFFAGDWVAGEGRVHRAFESGLDAGERIAERFG